MGKKMYNFRVFEITMYPKPQLHIQPHLELKKLSRNLPILINSNLNIVGKPQERKMHLLVHQPVKCQA